MPNFYTLPLYEGRHSWLGTAWQYEISIHSPRMGETPFSSVHRPPRYFYTLPLVWGETISVDWKHSATVDFYTLPSYEGGDFNECLSIPSEKFLYALPRMKGDKNGKVLTRAINFYTLPSYEGRLIELHEKTYLEFLYTPLVWGETWNSTKSLCATSFYTLPSYEGKTNTF